jgi:translation initiation factor 2B subunit (eIF-2B alpha/beta/delta family)
MRGTGKDEVSMSEVIKRVKRGSISSKVDCGLRDSLQERLQSGMQRATECMQGDKDKDARKRE